MKHLLNLFILIFLITNSVNAETIICNKKSRDIFRCNNGYKISVSAGYTGGKLRAMGRISGGPRAKNLTIKLVFESDEGHKETCYAKFKEFKGGSHSDIIDETIPYHGYNPDMPAISWNLIDVDVW